MSLIGGFKKEDTRGMASMALLFGVAATAGVVALSFRVNQQDRRIAELEDMVEANARVTLSLTSTVARLTTHRENPIT
ncbi:hypothetical protein DRD23_09405 [Salmonella enterica subsp. enterica serovar Enteritidis]|nr:hypothetical protein [Salmonella enterica subsp. enterica serovar Enteritidis]